MAFYSTTHCFSSPVWSTPPGAAFLAHVLPAMLGTTAVVQVQSLAPHCPQNNRPPQNDWPAPQQNARFAPAPASQFRSASVSVRHVAPQQRDQHPAQNGRSVSVEPSREREREHGRRDSRAPHRDNHYRRAERPEDHRARPERHEDRRDDRNRHERDDNRGRHERDDNRNRDERDGGGRRRESRGDKEPKDRERERAAAPRPAVRENEREHRRDPQGGQSPRPSNAVVGAASRAPRYHHSERVRLDVCRRTLRERITVIFIEQGLKVILVSFTFIPSMWVTADETAGGKVDEGTEQHPPRPPQNPQTSETKRLSKHRLPSESGNLHTIYGSFG
ncbi:hypothetical protein BDW22DRAFT_1343442 [Trametopsis cervina]|nr:hypothetical protein BDW22DRAFT_1343442 [Trametopsis cervina]